MATSCYKTKTAADKQRGRWMCAGTVARASESASVLAGDVLSGCPDESTGGEDVRKGGEIDLGDDRR